MALTSLEIPIIANKELQNSRLETCRQCDKFINDTTCDECGCYMILKVTIKQLTCPLGKW
jgi:hypothetical protein